VAQTVRKELFSQAEEDFIREAARFLCDPGPLIKGMNWIGQGVEAAQARLPARAREVVARSSRAAIEKAFEVALRTLPDAPSEVSFAMAQTRARESRGWHMGAASLVGGLGGAVGLLALPAELPLATIIMLRAIADTARHFGHDVSSPEGALECLYVFSVGTESTQDDALESSYYSSRFAFAQGLHQVSRFLATSSTRELAATVEARSTPWLVRLLADIAAQFELRVSSKVLAQAAPIAGFVGGAGINALFTNFFQQCARYHFGLRKLERERGYDETRARFESALTQTRKSPVR
jgi:hypothetical protein